MQIEEEAVMIEDPMESRGAYDDIERLLEREMKQIAGEKIEPSAELGGEMVAGGVQHVLGEIDTDHFTVGQRFKQVGSESSRSAARVQHGFVAAESKARQHLLSPAELRAREAVINR